MSELVKTTTLAALVDVTSDREQALARVNGGMGRRRGSSDRDDAQAHRT